MAAMTQTTDDTAEMSRLRGADAHGRPAGALGLAVIFAAGRPAALPIPLVDGAIELGRHHPALARYVDPRISRRHARVHQASRVGDRQEPDRPIITGRVYHGGNEVPYPLPDAKTKSTIKSNSSLGGGGFNELRFEDLKHAEQLFIHAQRNKDVCVRNDSMESVLHDRHLTVGAMREDGKVGDFHELTHRDRSITVHRNRDEHIGGNLRVRVGGIDGGGDTDLIVEGVRREHVRSSSHLRVDADRHEQVGETYFLHVRDLHILVDGAVHIKGSTLVVEADTLSLKGGGSPIHLDDAGIALEGPMVWLNSNKSTIAGAMNEETPVAAARRARPVQPRAADSGLVTYEAEFELQDEDGQPLPFANYVIRTASGREYPGTADENGCTETIHSFKEEDIEVEILGEGPCGS